MKRLNRILIALTLFFGSGCVNRPAGTSVAPDDIAASPSSVTTQQSVSTPREDSFPLTLTAPSTLQDLIESATADLAQRFSIPATEITPVEAKAVTWSDSSLGCPQEGFAYAQVLTPGYLIVLEHANTRYEYHAGKGPDVIYCPNPQPPVSNPDNT